MNLLESHIDLAALAHNMQVVAAHVGQASCMAVVKADAYNHGVEQVAPVLAANGAKRFGVATLAEAQRLQQFVDTPMTCWLWSPAQDFGAALATGIELAVPSMAHVKAVRAWVQQHSTPVTVCVKVDTGMHRSGVPMAELPQVLDELKDPRIAVTGLMSHFACADVPGEQAEAENLAQIAVFEEAIAQGRSQGFALERNHLANSAAIARYPQAHFEQVRPGVALYGLEPVDSHPLGLKPVMTLQARVVVVKDIEPGDGVSYGFTWRAEQPGRVAVVSVGYADGLWRSVQGHLQVGINGKLYPQIGRVCMDQIVVDLGDDPDQIQPDTPVTIFGAGGMSATELAQAVGTIHYEVVCSPKGRTVRTYSN